MTDRRDMLFRQEGRKVFQQVVLIVADLILTHLADQQHRAGASSWCSRLHQANKGMNDLIGVKVLGREPEPGEQPKILQDLRQYVFGGLLHHCLLQIFRPSCTGQPRCHLFVRRRLFGGQRDREEG